MIITISTEKLFMFLFDLFPLCSLPFSICCCSQIINNYSLTNTEHVLSSFFSFFFFTPASEKKNEREIGKFLLQKTLYCFIYFFLFFSVAVKCQIRRKKNEIVSSMSICVLRQTNEKREFLTFFNTMNMLFLVLIWKFA